MVILSVILRPFVSRVCVSADGVTVYSPVYGVRSINSFTMGVPVEADTPSVFIEIFTRAGFIVMVTPYHLPRTNHI